LIPRESKNYLSEQLYYVLKACELSNLVLAIENQKIIYEKKLVFIFYKACELLINTCDREMKSWSTSTSVRVRVHEYEYTSTSTRVRVHEYEYTRSTSARVPVRVHEYEYTSTNTRVRVHEYEYTSRLRVRGTLLSVFMESLVFRVFSHASPRRKRGGLISYF
jgi:negative regulator of genetic competence, sporulation and motility